ncbi:hypothetical protein GBA52_028802 [Prunus armeniaca]|nr:hypothetical protein GBA52_028802 [Prunus armeniaca]
MEMWRHLPEKLQAYHTSDIPTSYFAWLLRKQDECFLVYELCPMETLSEWLFGMFVQATKLNKMVQQGKIGTLPWIQRLEIAIDSARGLFISPHISEGLHWSIRDIMV